MATALDDTHAIGAVMTIKRIEARGSSIGIAEPRARRFFLTWLGFFLLGTLIYGGWARPLKGLPSRYEASGRIDKVGIALGDGWKLVGTQKGLQGREQFVLVKKISESDQKLYDDAIKHLCRVDEWCGLHFWSDPALIPTHLPMSDLQTAAEVADFTQNPDTGFAQFLWNCRIHPDPLNCFSYQ